MRRLRWLIALCLLGVILSTRTAGAQEERDVAVWQGDWNGMPLTVTVIAVNHTIPTTVRQTEPWWRWGNTTTDGYLFSFHKPEEVDLMLVFTEEEGKPRATIYVLSDEKQRKSLQIRQNRILLPPDTHPRAVIWPRQGDWLIDGKANFDLEVQEIDQNGVATWHASVGGERPGRPKWITRRLLQDPDPLNGYPRFGAAIREDPDVIYKLATPLMPSWPYLSVVKNVSHWGDDRPMFFDPDIYRLEMFWVGFQTAGIYTLNSLCYPPRVCFESPFVWYRFDPNAGRYANVVVRGDVWPKGVPFGPPSSDFQRTTLRMTWTAKDYDLWRYSLTMTGDHPMDKKVVIGDTTASSVPYAELLPWIASQDWKAVTFVEATQGEHGSEGIYDFSVEDNPPVSEWVNGLLAESPAIFHAPVLQEPHGGAQAGSSRLRASFSAPYLRYPQIHPDRLYEGFRGDYSMAYNRTPGLYLSPVDNRVHLLHAEGGLWNLGGGLVLRMHNLDAGAYIDGWTRESLPPSQAQKPNDIVIAVPGEVEEGIYALDGYLLYTGPAGVELRRPASQLSNPAVPLPTDKAHWQGFLDQREIDGTPRDPKDLKSWLSYFAGSVLEIHLAQLSDIRVTADGFRFVLALRSGFEAQGTDLLGVQGLQPGRYIVTYHRGNGGFTAQPLTPPNLSIVSLPTGLLLESGTESRPNTIGFSISNSGLEDAKDVRVRVTAANGTQRTIDVGEQSVSVLAQESTRLTFPWVPPDQGDWIIRVTASLPVGQGGEPAEIVESAHYQKKVRIASITLPTVSEAASGFGLVPPMLVVVLLVSASALASLGLLYLLCFHPASAREKGDA